jgi:carbamoyltransferase
LPRNYIGLANTCHDPALAIVGPDGRVRFAEAAERYLQNKRAWHSPPDDLLRSARLLEDHCDEAADLTVATTWRKPTLAAGRFLARTLMPLQRDMALRFGRRKMTAEAEWWLHQQLLNAQFIDAGMNPNSGDSLAFQNHVRRLHQAPDTTRRAYYHHLTHAAAACYTSPFRQAACIVIDGYGEDTALAYYHFKDGELIPLPVKKSAANASLGFFYSAVCWLAGFDPNKGEEWKVMGLAPYGKFDENIYQLLKATVRYEEGRLVPGKARWLGPELLALRRDPSQSPLTAADLAYTAQHYFCELMTQLCAWLQRRTGLENLVVGGGCALNSACNGGLLADTGFERLHVYAAPGDDGNALGAAWLAYFDDHPERRADFVTDEPHTAYLGTEISEPNIANLCRYGLPSVELRGPELYRKVAGLIADGAVVGWIQGRAEFGPRALGNRSILADPRRANVKEHLNANVKFREEFRPFAPSILHEHGDEYFERYQETPYMERALTFRSHVRDRVPGVVHVDGTGRLQTVKRAWNPRFHDLISAFHDQTGVPLLLNTSFNLMGKPIVHTLEDAISVYLTCGMDALVIGDRLFQKAPGAGAEAQDRDAAARGASGVGRTPAPAGA